MISSIPRRVNVVVGIENRGYVVLVFVNQKRHVVFNGLEVVTSYSYWLPTLAILL